MVSEIVGFTFQAIEGSDCEERTHSRLCTHSCLRSWKSLTTLCRLVHRVGMATARATEGNEGQQVMAMAMRWQCCFALR